MAELSNEPRKPDLGEEGNRLRAELRRETIARFAKWRHTKHYERYPMTEREQRAVVYGFNDGYAVGLAEGMRAGIQLGAETVELKGVKPYGLVLTDDEFNALNNAAPRVVHDLLVDGRIGRADR